MVERRREGGEEGARQQAPCVFTAGTRSARSASRDRQAASPGLMAISQTTAARARPAVEQMRGRTPAHGWRKGRPRWRGAVTCA